MEIIGPQSLPLIWCNSNKKIIILTNHRVASLCLNDHCEKNGYISFSNQYSLLTAHENDISTYKLYMFVTSPYSRMISINPGIMFYTTNDNIMNIHYFKSLMDDEERKNFEIKRRSGDINDWNYCLDLFIKYFEKYYEENTKCEIKNGKAYTVNHGFDGHIAPQTHPLIYNESLVNKCTKMDLKELGTPINKKILVELFDNPVMNQTHGTRYCIDKKVLLTPKYIQFINKYYSRDFELLNYTMRC